MNEKSKQPQNIKSQGNRQSACIKKVVHLFLDNPISHLQCEGRIIFLIWQINFAFFNPSLVALEGLYFG